MYRDAGRISRAVLSVSLFLSLSLSLNSPYILEENYRDVYPLIKAAIRIFISSRERNDAPFRSVSTGKRVAPPTPPGIYCPDGRRPRCVPCVCTCVFFQRAMCPMQISARARNKTQVELSSIRKAISEREINPRPEKSNFERITPEWRTRAKCEAKILACAKDNLGFFRYTEQIND